MVLTLKFGLNLQELSFCALCHSYALAQQWLCFLWAGRKPVECSGGVGEKRCRPGCRRCPLLQSTCFLSLSQVWGSFPPFLWGTGWTPVCKRLQKNGCPRPLTLHVCPQRCSPIKLQAPCHLLCRVADLHTKDSSGRVCTCITSQCSGLTEQGFEGPSAQRELQSGGLCACASRGDGGLMDTMGLQVWSEQELLYRVFNKPVYSPRVTFQIYQLLIEAGCISFCVFSVLSQLFSWLSCKSLIALKPKVSCLISSYY